MGEEPNDTTARKPGTLQIIQYSLLKQVVSHFRWPVSARLFTLFFPHLLPPPPRPRHPHCPAYARKHFPVLKINVASGAAQAGHWRLQKGQPIVTTVHIELHLRRTPLVQIQYCFMVILVRVDVVTNLPTSSHFSRPSCALVTLFPVIFYCEKRCIDKRLALTGV